MTRKPTPPAAAPDSALPADQFAGQGGSYVLDPTTGQRTLVERTMERGDSAAAPADDKE